jgi:hypothetical protein
MRREVQLEVVRSGQRLLRTATVDVDGFGEEHFVVAVAPVDDLTSAERQEAEDLAVRAVEDQLDSDAPSLSDLGLES